MEIAAYKLLLKKYFLVDFGVLMLLITIPLYLNSVEVSSIIQRALFYSGPITPIVSYFEITKSNQLPFFDNLNISIFPIYTVILFLKVIISLGLAIYV